MKFLESRLKLKVYKDNSKTVHIIQQRGFKFLGFEMSKRGRSTSTSTGNPCKL